MSPPTRLSYLPSIKTHFQRIIVLLALLCSSIARAETPVTIARNGKTSWHIQTVSSSKPCAFAAAELQNYLARISHAELPITNLALHGATIIIGLRSDLSAQDQALLPAPAPGHDGYSIAIKHNALKPDRIILAGDNDSGTVYAAYDFLEHLGCRWFYPTEDSGDPEVVPQSDLVALPTSSWSVASPLTYRICNGSGWFFEMEGKEAIQQLDWAMKNRYNMMGWQGKSSNGGHPLPWQYQHLRDMGVLAELEKRGMSIHGPAHSFDQFLKSDDYFKDHPEWFGLRNGKRVPQSIVGAQFCWSNPEARKQYIHNAEAFITNAPLVHIFCSLPFDGGAACECEQCKKMKPSNLLMLIMSEMIEQLKITRPDVVVEATGGYGPATEPPTDLSIIHPKQRIVWAHWARYHGESYDDDKYPLKPNLEKWRQAVHNQITICQYYTDNFAEPWVMAPFTFAMEGDRKYFLQHHIDSIYMLMYPRGDWWNHTLNGYLAGHCFYDVSLNPYDVLHDYALHYYGPDAGPMLAKYFEEWGRHCDLSYHIRGESTDADRATLAAERKNWITPAAAAASNDPIYSRRVAKQEKLHTLAERLMEMHRQQAEIKKARHAGNLTEAATLLEKSRTYTDHLLEYFYSLADLNQGLMDRKEVPTFIRMNLKNWIGEEEKKIAAAKTKLKH